MWCCLDFDKNKNLADQEVNTWSQMQSLDEEPAYKESDIKSQNNKDFFHGFKMAMDNVCTILDNLEDDEELSGELNEKIQMLMQGDIVNNLYSILDSEVDLDDQE